MGRTEVLLMSGTKILISENERLRAQNERLKKELYLCKNELCLVCGNYKEAHLGACDDCHWYCLREDAI